MSFWEWALPSLNEICFILLLIVSHSSLKNHVYTKVNLENYGKLINPIKKIMYEAF